MYRSHNTPYISSIENGLFSTSLLGDEGGRIIPASCPSNLHDDPTYGTTCKVTDACNIKYKGVYQCGGECSVSMAYPAPKITDFYYLVSDKKFINDIIITDKEYKKVLKAYEAALAAYPASCTSAPNACGAVGTGVKCGDGSCSATTPAVPANLGTICHSEYNSCNQRNTGTYQCDGSCSATIPANPTNYGNSCNSAPNACGATNTGTITCSGSCTATTPDVPVGYGTACVSAPNSCGMTNSGTRTCSGTCSAVTPSELLCPVVSVCGNASCEVGETVASCPADCTGSCGDGICSASESHTSCAADCAAVGNPINKCDITATPKVILKKSKSILAWDAPEATSCSVVGRDATGAIVDSRTFGNSGSTLTVTLTVPVTYILTCVNAAYSCVSPPTNIRVVAPPAFKEI